MWTLKREFPSRHGVLGNVGFGEDRRVASSIHASRRDSGSLDSSTTILL